jgi:hypothetical protein
MTLTNHKTVNLCLASPEISINLKQLFSLFRIRPVDDDYDYSATTQVVVVWQKR